MPTHRRLHPLSGLGSLVLAAFALAVCGPHAALSQPPPPACSALAFSQPEAGARRYVLDRVEGQAVLASADPEKNAVNMGGVCIALFTEKERKQAAAVATDNQGAFSLTGLAPGRYTLVAGGKGVRGLALPVELITGSGKPALLLRLREEGDKEESRVTLVTDPELRRELLKRLEQDQAIRQEMIKSGADHPDPKVIERMTAIDAQDTARMKEIVQQHGGWPGTELVGMDGTEAAFLLVQHADADRPFQKEMLPLVEKAYHAGALRGQEFALLTDRVRVAEGKPQVYGTQAKFQGKEVIPDPIEDAAQVDKRRAAVGLPPLAEYLKMMKDFYFPPDPGKP